MNPKIRVDPSATIKGLENLVKQVRFATSKAMNDAAFIARDAERRHVEDAFTVRRPFVLQGIQVERPYATKANLTVALSVEPKRDFLAKFEEGGTKTPQGQHLAVPDAQTFDRSRVVPRGKRPKALQLRSTTTKGGRVQIEGKQRTYLVTTPKGEGIFQRVGKGTGSKSRLLYWLTTKAHIDPDLKFVDTVTTTFLRAFSQRFTQQIANALRTAR